VDELCSHTRTDTHMDMELVTIHLDLHTLIDLRHSLVRAQRFSRSHTLSQPYSYKQALTHSQTDPYKLKTY